MQFSDIWAILKEAGPTALFGFAAIMWWLERTRANDERKINEERTAKFYEVTGSLSAGMTSYSNTMDKAIEVLRQREAGSK